MYSLAKITWRSITVLPPLIGASVCAVVILALNWKLSLHLSFGLLASVLALVEIAYLGLLILANRSAEPNSVRTPFGR